MVDTMEPVSTKHDTETPQMEASMFGQGATKSAAALSCEPMDSPTEL